MPRFDIVSPAGAVVRSSQEIADAICYARSLGKGHRVLRDDGALMAEIVTLGASRTGRQKRRDRIAT